MGLWRRGSAPPWHGGGRGFESRQLHQIKHHLLIKNTLSLSLSVDGFIFAQACNGDGSYCIQVMQQEPSPLHPRCMLWTYLQRSSARA